MSAPSTHVRGGGLLAGFPRLATRASVSSEPRSRARTRTRALEGTRASRVRLARARGEHTRARRRPRRPTIPDDAPARQVIDRGASAPPSRHPSAPPRRPCRPRRARASSGAARAPRARHRTARARARARARGRRGRGRARRAVGRRDRAPRRLRGRRAARARVAPRSRAPERRRGGRERTLRPVRVRGVGCVRALPPTPRGRVYASPEEVTAVSIGDGSLARRTPPRPLAPPSPCPVDRAASATYDPLCEFINPLLDDVDKLDCGEAA